VGGAAVVTATVQTLRDALLGEARAEAQRLLAAADERAATGLVEAEKEGKALVERSRAEGEAAAAMAGAREQAQARRLARALLLAARREVYEELVARSRAAAEALRDDPVYESLLDRWSAAAREQLGDDAVLALDPPSTGGVLASSGSRHVDYTLHALVDRCLDRLGGELGRLWSDHPPYHPVSAGATERPTPAAR
jgi:vacuolar-type H+-ATPase subunit E/Vma4